MVYNVIFNNISVISWRSVLLVEGKKSLTNFITYVVSSTPCHERGSNSQSTIMTKTAPVTYTCTCLFIQ